MGLLVLVHSVTQGTCFCTLTKFSTVYVLFTYYITKEGRFEIMLVSISYLIRNCLDLYSLGLDNVPVTPDVLVCLLNTDCLLHCKRVLLDRSLQEGISQLPFSLTVVLKI